MGHCEPKYLNSKSDLITLQWTEGCTNGESPQEMADRCDQVVDFVREHHRRYFESAADEDAAGDILIVTHGHFSRVCSQVTVCLFTKVPFSVFCGTMARSATRTRTTIHGRCGRREYLCHLPFGPCQCFFAGHHLPILPHTGQTLSGSIERRGILGCAGQPLQPRWLSRKPSGHQPIGAVPSQRCSPHALVSSMYNHKTGR